jgi:hypothetical protein
MAVGFPAKTSFTDGQALPASDLNDISGTLNLLYSSSSWPGQISYNDGSYPRYVTFATQIDVYSPSSSLASGASVDITFNYNTTRFSHTPICFPSVYHSGVSTVALVANVESVSAGTVTVQVRNVGTTTVTSSNWSAYCLMLQALPSQSNG